MKLRQKMDDEDIQFTNYTGHAQKAMSPSVRTDAQRAGYEIFPAAPNLDAYESDYSKTFMLPKANSPIPSQRLGKQRQIRSSISSPSKPFPISIPSNYTFISLSMSVFLIAFIAPQTCTAQTPPTYTIPQTNTSSKSTVVDLPALPDKRTLSVFTIANSRGLPRSLTQRRKVATWPAEVKIGVLLPRFSDLNDVVLQPVYAMEYNLPAIKCAVDDVTLTRRIIPSVVKVKVSIPSRPLRHPSQAPIEAFEMTYDGRADVLFGPYDIWPAAQINRYAMRWNVPVLTTSGLIFTPRNPFMQTTRMQASTVKLGVAITRMIRHFNYSVIGVVYEKDLARFSENLFLYLVRPMFGNFKTPSFEPFHQTIEGKGSDMRKILEELKEKCRIIVLCASQDSVREIMIKAHELEFDNGEYVFFNIDLFSSHNATLKPWYRANDTDARNSAARKAYESLMTVTLRQPTSPQYKQFSKDVKAKAAQIYPNFTYGDEEVNSFVGAFYDAVLLYATALNETIDAGGNVTDGINITRRMWNRTFDGITGKVSIDENGDRNADYSLLDMDPKTGEFQVVADYYGTSKTYNEIQKIHWPGGRDGPPPDTPKCGFDGSKCPAKKPFPAYIIVIIVLGSVLIVVCIVGAFVYRHVKLEAELSEMNWRVKWDDIMFGGPTRNDKKSEKQNSQRISYSSDCSADTIAVHLSDVANKQLYTKTGYYKGAILAIKPIPRTHISMTKPLLMDIKKMKDLQNDHLVRFHGVCIDVPNQCILTEYCPKGSLQDVLENDEIKLDWMFRYSIMQDIVRGMTYLHSTDIKSHGHLKSSNCVVDSRFVVKITDFGLHYFKEKEEELEDDTYAIARSKLWTAPELLRLTNPPSCGTHKADVYSFAIICQEIVYRNGAFYLQNLDLQPSEITDKVRKGMKPLFRPTLEEFDCPSDELAGVIRRCWAEEPAERPDFQGLRTLIKKLNKDGDKGDILDNLLTRMEQYANNLEALVEERTADYLQEKKKAEELLYNMLPRSVAIQLIRGEVIKAEWFDSVTIYFSDICGFTALSAESTPMQVVDLLNDLYTVFDSIIDNFDVYKVETIGDAYMVVSGLPVKNGSLHAREIARMSLALLDAVFRFKIRHRPNDQLKLRIGIHSGPVCAGVVGLKMPRYCLFGDTVNTSSRMESNGLPLRIHVSPFTQEILLTFGTFHLEMRGPVEMKGKGTVITHWLLGEDNSPYNIQQQGMNQPTAPVTTSIATVTPTTSTSVTTSSVSPTSPEAKSSRKLSLKSLIH